MKLNDEKGYERSFQALIEKRADIPSDHVNYWRLLKSIGQKDKAIELAKIYSSLPNSSEEIVRLANAYTELELRELAGKLFKRYAGQFVDSDELWLAHANLLMEGQSWTELLDLAGQIRREKYAREKLEAYSYYMEGRARLGLKQPALAEAAFHKIPEYVFHNTTQGLITGANLLQLGFPDPSVRILLKLQNSMEDNYIYWQLVKSCAEQLKQTNQMLSAAAKIKRLQEKSASGAQEMR
jgi:predicted Zn-dependent protease